jgi:hypothetical protein
MCCGDKEMQGHHAGHTMHGAPHMGKAHGMCGCGGRMFLSRKEKIEMLEEYRVALKNELDGVEEELKELQKEQ